MKSLQSSVQGRGGPGKFGGRSPAHTPGQITEGWMEKKAQGLGSRERRGPGHWRREAARAAGCGVVIRVEEGLDVQVASPPSPSLPSSLPFPSTLLPSLSPSSLQLSLSLLLFPSPQGSGPSAAAPSTRRASAAVCRALASFGGAERAAAGCAARWCPSARWAAPRTAPVPARRRPRAVALAPPPFGPLIREPAARGARHPGSSSLAVSPARPPTSRHRSRRLVTAPRARGRGCACGGPGKAQASPRTQGVPRLVCRRRDSLQGAPVTTGTSNVRPGPVGRVAGGGRVPRTQ